MKLEEGKLYQTRDPARGPVTVKSEFRQHSTVVFGAGHEPGSVAISVGFRQWIGSNGRVYADDGRECWENETPADLVAEAPTTPNLEQRVTEPERKAESTANRAQEIEKTRMKFESWAKIEKLDVRRILSPVLAAAIPSAKVGDYLHAYTQQSWRGWLAARELA